MTNMIVLTWNVALGRGTPAAFELAGQLAADVVLLQEASINAAWPGLSSCREPVAQRDWGSAVFVRGGTLESIALPGYAGWVAGARWSPGTTKSSEAIYMFSVHSPTKSVQEARRGYVAESVQIVQRICSLSFVPQDAPLIIGGDFNFKSFGEPVSDKSTAISRSEAEALRQFRELHLVVAWRDTHPDLPLPQTLRWSGNKMIPYHCDGFLLRGVDKATMHCEVLTGASVAKHSDHNPVVSWFGVAFQ